MTLVRQIDASALTSSGTYTSLHYSGAGDIIVLGSERPVLLPRAGNDPEVLDDFDRQYGGGAGIARLERIGGDTLLVVDRGGNRLSVWAHDAGLIGHLATPPSVTLEDARVLRWPDRVAALALRAGRRELLLLSRSGDHMVIDATIRLHSRHSLKNPNTVTLGNAADDGMWIAQSRPGELSRISAQGSVTSRIERNPDWVGEYSFPASPDPYIAELHQDTDGTLWLFWRVAHRGTGPALVQASRGIRPHDRRGLFDTVIEVLDPGSGRVRARGHISGYVVTVLPDRHAVIHERRAGEEGTIRIYRLEVRSNP